MTTDGANDGFEYHRFERHYTERPNVTESRLRLLWAALTTKVPGRTLSIGAGTGDVEEALRERYGFTVDEIVEPSDALFPAILEKGLPRVEGHRRGISLRAGIVRHYLLQRFQPRFHRR